MDGFESATTAVNGLGLHHVHGGAGQTLLLIHGFPQDWYEWRGIMERLARRFTVVAVDLRGVGGSDAPADGYEAETMAGDLYGLVDALNLQPANVVGHDVGGWVAYAYGRRYPAMTTSVTIVETLIPGIEPFADAKVDAPLWHGEFHMIPQLPEALVAERQAVYFRYFFDVGTVGEDAISEDDLSHYVQAYGEPARLHAAFEMYRAVPANIAFNDGQRERIDVPLLLAGGEHVFGPVLDDVAANLRANFGWEDVSVEVLVGGQHYLVEERSDDIASLIESHAR